MINTLEKCISQKIFFQQKVRDYIIDDINKFNENKLNDKFS